jgi:predicted CopG family antitoxin
MSKNISISDEVYEKLKSEKKERSFSEVIEEKIDSGGNISEVAGSKVLDRETMKDVKDEIREVKETSRRKKIKN